MKSKSSKACPERSRRVKVQSFKRFYPLPFTLYPIYGFTIIELLISIAIIFIVLGLTFAGYREFSHRQSLISAGQNLKNIIRDVQSRAYTGEVDCNDEDCDCGPSTESTLVGWYIDFGEKKIYGECTGGYFGEKSYSLDKEITVITEPSSPESLQFRYQPAGSNRNMTICLSSDYLSNSYYKISVSTSGEISDSRGIVSSCP